MDGEKAIFQDIDVERSVKQYRAREQYQDSGIANGQLHLRVYACQCSQGIDIVKRNTLPMQRCVMRCHLTLTTILSVLVLGEVREVRNRKEEKELGKEEEREGRGKDQQLRVVE